MSESDDFRRHADECFQKAETAANQFSRAFWLGLGKQWARMVDETETAPPSVAAASEVDLSGLLEEALFEKALALSAARVTSCVGAQ